MCTACKDFLLYDCSQSHEQTVISAAHGCSYQAAVAQPRFRHYLAARFERFERLDSLVCAMLRGASSQAAAHSKSCSKYAASGSDLLRGIDLGNGGAEEFDLDDPSAESGQSGPAGSSQDDSDASLLADDMDGDAGDAAQLPPKAAAPAVQKAAKATDLLPTEDRYLLAVQFSYQLKTSIGNACRDATLHPAAWRKSLQGIR